MHVNVNCTDLAQSLPFYETIGFKVMHVFGEGVDRLDPDGDPLAGRSDAATGHTRGVVLTLGDHPRCFTKLELLHANRLISFISSTLTGNAMVMSFHPLSAK